MTSNLASQQVAQLANDRAAQERAVNDVLRHTFKPEFLNRVDDIIIFQQLTKPEIAKIVELQLKLVAERLERRGIELTITPAAAKYLAEAGFDEVFGARPLKRLIQNEILDELSLRIVEGKIKEGAAVRIDYDKGAIQFG